MLILTKWAYTDLYGRIIPESAYSDLYGQFLS